MIHLSASEPLVLAKSESRGHAWWAELLIFVLVFLIASTVMGFPVGIATSVWIFTSDTFANIVAQFSLADTADLSQSIPQITSALFASMPAWLTLVSLFADALTIAVCLVYCRVIEKRSIRSVGFTRHGFAKEYALGFLIGAGLLAAAFAISALTGSVKLTGFNTAVAFPKLLGMLILFLLGYMIQGMAEEVLCRGYFMLSFARKSPVWAAILISSSSSRCCTCKLRRILPRAVQHLPLRRRHGRLYPPARIDLDGRRDPLRLELHPGQPPRDAGQRIRHQNHSLYLRPDVLRFYLERRCVRSRGRTCRHHRAGFRTRRILISPCQKKGVRIKRLILIAGRGRRQDRRLPSCSAYENNVFCRVMHRQGIIDTSGVRLHVHLYVRRRRTGNLGM